MFRAYPVIVHEAENGGYWAEFVDFNAFTQGDTLDELISNAEESMICYLDGETDVPEPSDICSIHTKDGEFTTLIRADVPSFASRLAFAGAVAMA